MSIIFERASVRHASIPRGTNACSKGALEESRAGGANPPSNPKNLKKIPQKGIMGVDKNIHSGIKSKYNV